MSLAAGCGVLLGAAEDWPVVDDASAGASGGVGGAGGEGAAEGGASPGCDLVHVDGAKGNDESDGCSPSAPMRTIQAAIDRVTSDAKTGSAIAVCAGSYDGPVTVDFPVSLRGGYDCSTWSRPDDYGYPEFADASRTTITNPEGSGATLVVSSPVIDASVSIDGFRIEGGAGRGRPTEGVRIIHGGPRLSNCWVTGGSGAGTMHGSVGVEIGEAGWPEIALDRIDGGSGKATGNSYGSVGLLVTDKTAYPHVHDSQLDGGSGTAEMAGYGSTGAVLFLSSPNPLSAAWGKAFEGNRINGGGGSSCAQRRNALELSCAGSDVSVIGNRIYGGDGVGSAETLAVLVNSTKTTNLINNMIHGGNGANSALGVVTQAVSGTVVEHNSIFAGSPADTGLSAAIFLDAGTFAAMVDANLLFATEVAGGYPSSLRLSQCVDSGTIIALRDNWLASPLRYSAPGGNCPTDVIPPAEIEQEVSAKCTAMTPGVCQGLSGAIAKENIQGDCSDALPSCASALFGSWSAADHGGSDLMAVGWKLQATAPCAVTQTMYTLYPPVDLYGEPRTAPVSIGAHEWDGACGR